MKLDQALEIALRRKAELAPYCERIEIAGSIRRLRPEPHDIEMVAIPKPYEVGLFASGIAPIVNRWEKVKGELPCKYTQRMLPEGIVLDLFFARPENWGLIYAIRTGSADYSHWVLAAGWVRMGYHSVDGMLTWNGEPVPVREEQDLFAMAGVAWCRPEERRVYQRMERKGTHGNRTLVVAGGDGGDGGRMAGAGVAPGKASAGAVVG